MALTSPLKGIEETLPMSANGFSPHGKVSASADQKVGTSFQRVESHDGDSEPGCSEKAKEKEESVVIPRRNPTEITRAPVESHVEKSVNWQTEFASHNSNNFNNLDALVDTTTTATSTQQQYPNSLTQALSLGDWGADSSTIPFASLSTIEAAREAQEETRITSQRGFSGTQNKETYATQQQLTNVSETGNVNNSNEQASLQADQEPMVYTNPIESPHRSTQNASSKMEITPSLHSSSSEPKDEDDHSIGSSSVGATHSPVMLPLHPAASDLVRPGSGTGSGSNIGTPSTVSTAPSTDEASADGTDSVGLDRAMWRLDDAFQSSLLPPRSSGIQSIPARISGPNAARMPSPETSARGEPLFGHRRTRSWEAQQRDSHPYPGQEQQAHRQGWDGGPFSMTAAATSSRGGTWEQTGSPQTRVASFRSNAGATAATIHGDARHGYSGVAPRHDSWRFQEPHQAHGHQVRVNAGPGPGYHHPSYGPYHGGRNPAYGHPHGAHTPPRSRQPRSPVHTPSRPPSAPSTPPGSGPTGPNPPRTSSEVLKTLLRKKACLYEPDTSRAVAVVTWLVGRELALAFGYFSRQQLQSGVHACVANKIDSGIITRTKVNRCMQIILNSCFHYIIPRPDGKEENGEAFRAMFASRAVDDSNELESLQVPWDGLVVDKDLVMGACANAEADGQEGKGRQATSPSSSPRAGSQQSKAQDDGDTKRAVLLCFNENVRSAADVFRCHNEFIRDTANASNLQLSAQEWRTFFGRDAVKTTAAWGDAGMSTAVAKSEGDITKLPDVLGRMGADELAKFRTTWCAKRYEHDHTLCGFAHVEVNGGWLRRNPMTHNYRPEMCPGISDVTEKTISPYAFRLNQCEKGRNCELAHSVEEIRYHPDNYKHKICASASTRNRTCPLGDVCPNFHTSKIVTQGKRRSSPDSRSHPSSQRSSGYRHSHGHGSQAGSKLPVGVPPEGSPMLYVRPAPFSSYEEQLGTPGLRSLFRRHSAVVSGHLKYGERCKCCYTNFGDDWGMGVRESGEQTTPACRGLPSLPGAGPVNEPFRRS